METFAGKRISLWVPPAGRVGEAQVPQDDEVVLAVVAEWSSPGRAGTSRSHVEVLERVVVGPDAVESTETTPIKLGSWAGDQRTRRAALSEEQIAALAEHGLVLVSRVRLCGRARFFRVLLRRGV